MRWFILFVALSWLRILSAEEDESWVVYYNDQLPSEAFTEYNLLVFDSTYHPPLVALEARDRVILGYISLGEVEKYRPHYEKVKHLLSEENPNWPGSYYIDQRDSLWPRIVIEELIQDILAQGFDGIIIDTMDNPIYMEDMEPEKYKGMKAAAVQMIKAIRMHFPSIKIMLNRAMEILPQVGGDIDYVLGESILTHYDFKEKKCRLTGKKEYQAQVDRLKQAQTQYPNLKVVTLDYWDPKDKKGVQEIYKKQRANGFRPYVATIDLKTLTPEPKL
jgi:uncharacterized protein (TIGR01370 family)